MRPVHITPRPCLQPQGQYTPEAAAASGRANKRNGTEKETSGEDKFVPYEHSGVHKGDVREQDGTCRLGHTNIERRKGRP